MKARVAAVGSTKELFCMSGASRSVASSIGSGSAVIAKEDCLGRMRLREECLCGGSGCMLAIACSS